jgi:hypothetical protein
MGLQVWRLEWQYHTLDTDRIDNPLKRPTEFPISVMNQLRAGLQESPVGHSDMVSHLGHPVLIRTRTKKVRLSFLTLRDSPCPQRDQQPERDRFHGGFWRERILRKLPKSLLRLLKRRVKPWLNGSPPPAARRAWHTDHLAPPAHRASHLRSLCHLGRR